MTKSVPKNALSGKDISGKSGKGGFSGYRALVVDDDPDIRGIINEVLSSVGYEVQLCSSAGEALKAAESNPPDVLISDWQMPDLNGIDLVNKLKDRDPHLSAILMTGYGTKETVIEAFTRGRINYFLSKPFRLEELRDIVASSIRERNLRLSETEFRRRLEMEIQRATGELEKKNRLLENKNLEVQNLFRELQARQEEVVNTKDYLERLLTSSVDGIISTDPRYRIDFFSRGAEEMFGLSSDDVVGKPIAGLFAQGEDDLLRLRSALSENRSLKHFEAEMLGLDSSSIIVDISASWHATAGAEPGLLLIVKDIADRKRLEEELRSSNQVLEKLSVTDGLTGLYNHRHLKTVLTDEFQRARRYRNPISFIMVDIDDFKVVNDTYGHQAGDQVLALLAELLRENLREVDIPARYGGEEFSVILPQTDATSAIYVAERIRSAVEQSFRFREIDHGISLTVSLGLSSFPDPGIKTDEDLIRFADKALYKAKQVGKNRVVLGDSSGERPLGKGERLTSAEKKAILRRVGDNLRRHPQLSEMLNYLLKEISDALKVNGQAVPCSVVLLDSHHGPLTEASLDVPESLQGAFEKAAQQALIERKIQILDEDIGHGQLSSFPIFIDSAENGQSVVGVINIGSIPNDLEFFQDLANQVAWALINAKLHREAEESKKALSRRVEHLTLLSMMGMALQHNALNLEDYYSENLKLVARCLAQSGFQKVRIYEYDPWRRILYNGVDDSLHGNKAPSRLDLSRLPETTPWAGVLFQEKPKHFQSVSSFKLGEQSKNQGSEVLFEALGLDSGEAALAPLIEGNHVRSLVMVGKQEISAEDRDILSMLVLHAGLIMDNLSLGKLFQNKSNRLSLIHEIGMKLLQADSTSARQKAIAETVDKMAQVLSVGEISVYSYSAAEQAFNLVAYSSASARPGRRPLQTVRTKDCPIMNLVARRAMQSHSHEPLCYQDIRQVLGKSARTRFKTSSYLGAPLYGRDEFLGVLNITDKLDGSAMTTDDVELAGVTAGILSLTLQDALAISSLEKSLKASAAAIAALLEEHIPGERPGRTGKVSAIVMNLLDSPGELQLDRSEIERHSLLLSLRKLNGQAKTLTDTHPALTPLTTLVGIMTESSPLFLKLFTGGAEAYEHETQLERLWPLAENIEKKYMAVPARRRPPLAGLIFEMIGEVGQSFNKEAVEVLLKGLKNGKLKLGGRKEKAGTVLAELASLLQTEAKKPSGGYLSKALLRHFLNLLKKETATVND